MAHTDWNQRIREEVEAIKAGGLAPSPAAETACQASDLKGLLNTIVEQISDADRRHTDSLVQMQERLSTLGREAHSLRSKVPAQYAAAFERIEAGMADLALRIAETGDVRASRADADQSVAAHRDILSPPAAVEAALARAAAPAAAPQFMAEPPMALRTAADAAPARKREDEVKRYPNVDTFDVIESSLPPNVSDPWDRDSAEALAGVYDDSADPYAATLDGNGHRSYTTPVSMAMPAPAAVPAIDHDWLEARFTEISSRIEQSLAELRPDHAFFALNQRIDQLENHFSGLMEGAASHADVEGVRLIEAHMSEFATHLDTVHNQLARLDEIEGQISAIAGKLNDVHEIASAAASGGESYASAPAAAPFDIDAVAKAAAEHVATRFADMKAPSDPSNAIENVHGLVEQLMNESRQGDENTSMLLDTLQQAMIRLLDRVDAMEITQHQTLQAQQAHSLSQDYGREQMRFSAEPQRPSYANPESTGALDVAVAAVATAKAMQGPFSHVPGSEPHHEEMPERQARPTAAAATPQATRSPDKIRQDFIAEARRAKLRLAAEQEEGDVVITKPVPEAAAAAAPAAAAKPEKTDKRGDKAGKTKAPANGKAAQSMPRLMVMGLGVLTLLGGLWYIMQGGGMLGGDVAAPAAITAPGAMPSEKGVSDAQPADPAAVPAPKTQSNDRSDLVPGDATTVGEIVTGEIADGATSVPLGGIAVDAQHQTTSAEIQRAQRTQAMAAMSTKIGQAAAKTNGAGPATPASLIPDAYANAAQQGVTAVEKNTMTRRSALDMPPVTVGPLSLRLAAANGDPSAEFEVGARLAEGKGTGQSFEEAAKWYQRSADQGFVQSQYRLGTLYERGLGVKPDLAQAETWYKRAAEQGNIKAMHNLAVLSANQNKASPDYVTAAKWFTDAAERGLSDSQFNLAVLYENGLGVPQDGKQAYKWLSLAARSGDKEAVRRRDIMKGKLTAEELAAAELMIKTYSGKVPDAMANDARSAGEAWKKNPANGQNG